MRMLTFIVLTLYSMLSEASSIHHYTFDRIDFSDADVNISAELIDTKDRLKYFRISTPYLKFELSDELKKKILNPKLNSISYALVPYDVENGGMYLRTVYLSFFGDERCVLDETKWAPEDKLVIVFRGKDAKASIKLGNCGA
jgi:hypothetical protein